MSKVQETAAELMVMALRNQAKADEFTIASLRQQLTIVTSERDGYRGAAGLLETKLTTAHAEGRAEERDVVLAWLLDRAEQYPNNSGYRCVFDELFAGIRRGDHRAAWEHGELDDLALAARGGEGEP